MRCYTHPDYFEVDFYRESRTHLGCLSRFNTMKSVDINTDIDELVSDSLILEISEFWDKYEEELTGKWYGDHKIILHGIQ